MQYYRLGETLEPLENLSPEETHLLAVLRPEELHSAPLPAGLPLPVTAEEPRENQYCTSGRERCPDSSAFRPVPRSRAGAFPFLWQGKRFCWLITTALPMNASVG